MDAPAKNTLHDSFHTVGIGASAGGLEALLELLSALPADREWFPVDSALEAASRKPACANSFKFHENAGGPGLGRTKSGAESRVCHSAVYHYGH